MKDFIIALLYGLLLFGSLLVSKEILILVALITLPISLLAWARLEKEMEVKET